mmetsp:Transcript_27906/g.39393  ORF Transcript_27906/g.39393 Transcript_27906/m.39393 type:complete len:233 (-) Transcript_27906:565-1263(-)
MPPHGSKDVVQLDVDSREGKEARKEEDKRGGAVPHDGRDLPLDLVSFARCLIRRRRFTPDRANNGQRKRDQTPQENDDDDGAEGQCGGRLVPDGNRVDKAEDQKEGSSKQGCSQDGIQSPLLSTPLHVGAGCNVAADGGRESVNEHGSRVQPAPVSRVEKSHQGQEQDTAGQCEELDAGTYSSRQQHSMLREAKHVPVHELPATVFLVVIIIIVHVHVTSEIFFEDSHEDNG